MRTKSMSEETKRKLSASVSHSLMGHSVSKKTRRRQRLAHLGQNLSLIHKLDCQCCVCKAKRGETRGKDNPFFGKHPSLEAQKKRSLAVKKLWRNLKYRQTQVAAMLKASHIKPTRPEIQLNILLDKTFPGEYRYVGNGEVVIAGKNPDFININGKKKIIEMFGNYWHRGENPQRRIGVFKPYGFGTLVVWEKELRDLKSLKRRLERFHNKFA